MKRANVSGTLRVPPTNGTRSVPDTSSEEVVKMKRANVSGTLRVPPTNGTRSVPDTNSTL
jgi:hypothetical protein